MAVKENVYKRMKFLIIDDFPAMCKQIDRILYDAGGRQIDSCFSGEEAMALCQKTQYDVIFADYNLGAGKNGQQLLEELRYRGMLKSTCTYIMITAEATRDFVYGALEFQPDGYINKPFTQAELLRRMDRMVHEKLALSDVLNAAAQGDWSQAISLCIEKMQSEPRKRMNYLRLLGTYYHEAGESQRALDVYEQVLSVRELDWAIIGKARAAAALGRKKEARDLLNPLVAANTPYMVVYDTLYDLAMEDHDTRAAQTAMEHALALSPNSVRRQSQLAELGEQHQDWLVTEKARKRAMKAGEFSMHENPSLYIDYANSINNVVAAGLDQSKSMAGRYQESIRTLTKVRDKYRDPVVDLRANIAAAATNLAANKADKAAELLEKVEESYLELSEQLGDALGGEAGMEMAQLLHSKGDEDRAQDILKQLAETYPDDENLARRIDRLSEEPLSQSGKAAAIELNREGKGYFEAQQYDRAIQLFDRAMLLYPNNIGLKLNLVLAMVRYVEKDGPDDEAKIDRCREVLASVEGKMSPEHRFYKLFQRLRESVASL